MNSIVGNVVIHVDEIKQVEPPANYDHSDFYRTSVFLCDNEKLIHVQLAGSIDGLRNLANNLNDTVDTIEAALKEKANV
jgi:hypothetical protein